MLLGTTAKAWLVRHMPAYVVSLIAVGEPIGATMLGMALPGIHEMPSRCVVFGGFITITGVIGVLHYNRVRPLKAAP